MFQSPTFHVYACCNDSVGPIKLVQFCCRYSVSKLQDQSNVSCKHFMRQSQATCKDLIMPLHVHVHAQSIHTCNT